MNFTLYFLLMQAFGETDLKINPPLELCFILLSYQPSYT